MLVAGRAKLGPVAARGGREPRPAAARGGREAGGASEDGSRERERGEGEGEGGRPRTAAMAGPCSSAERKAPRPWRASTARPRGPPPPRHGSGEGPWIPASSLQLGARREGEGRGEGRGEERLSEQRCRRGRRLGAPAGEEEGGDAGKSGGEREWEGGN